MKPKGAREADYAMMLEGLETLAGVLKERKKPGDGRPAGVRSALRAVRRNGLKEGLRKWRILRSGVDRDLRRDAPAEEPRGPERYFSEERVAVYMAMFGNYDEIREPLIQPDNVDYFLISDAPPAEGSRWTWLSPDSLVPEAYRRDPALANRWCKMHPHRIFPDYRLSVYLDSNFWIVSDLTALVSGMGAFPLAMFLHKNRDCVYEEIRACRIKGKAPEAALRAHEALLRAHGVPEKSGLLEAPVLVRRHHDPECVRLMDAWWDAFLAGCRRDQISLADALWLLKIPVRTVGTLGSDFRRCNLLIAMPHGAGGRP